MKLENRFTVPASADTAWRVLLDVERIAPCMPGATLTDVDGDTFTGKVKVKLGPINLTYGGTARIVSRDDEARVAVIEGAGKETRGTGTAKATITCRLREQGSESTAVEVDTDLTITGKPAQFGRGVLADVSAKLVDQFAACLAEEIRGAEASAAPAVAAAEPGSGDPGSGGGAPAATGPAGTGPAAAETEGSGKATVDGPTPPAGDGVGAGADGAAAAAAVVAGDARSSAGETVGAGGTDAAAGGASGATGGLAAGPSGPGVPVTGREAAPEGARQAPTSPSTDRAPGQGARPRPRRSAEAIDLLDAAGAPVAKRLLPVLLGAVAVVLLARRLLR